MPVTSAPVDTAFGERPALPVISIWCEARTRKGAAPAAPRSGHLRPRRLAAPIQPQPPRPDGRGVNRRGCRCAPPARSARPSGPRGSPGQGVMGCQARPVWRGANHPLSATAGGRPRCAVLADFTRKPPASRPQVAPRPPRPAPIRPCRPVPAHAPHNGHSCTVLAPTAPTNVPVLSGIYP